LALTQIWKYQVELHGETLLKMPKGAKVLSVQNKDKTINLWAQVVDGPCEERLFHTFLTGEDFLDPENYTFLATVQIGWYVAHVFEKAIKSPQG
jgi:hypothetical protein